MATIKFYNVKTRKTEDQPHKRLIQKAGPSCLRYYRQLTQPYFSLVFRKIKKHGL
jgi:hypothetical protein